MKWYHKLSNAYHEWARKLPWNVRKGYCHIRYMTREEVWHQNMMSTPTNEVRKAVKKAFKRVVKYDAKENNFWEVGKNGTLKRLKQDKSGYRKPVIGFCCDKCGICGEFDLFEVPNKGAYCYPDAYKELV